MLLVEGLSCTPLVSALRPIDRVVSCKGGMVRSILSDSSSLTFPGHGFLPLGIFLQVSRMPHISRTRLSASRHIPVESQGP